MPGFYSYELASRGSRGGPGGGQGIVLPFTLPGPGESTEISGNLAQDIRPAGWSTTQFNYALFNSYGFGPYVPDFSALGAVVLGPAGGHLHPDFPCAAPFDLTTGLWSLLEHTNGGTLYGGANADKGYNLSQTSGSPYYEITGSGETPCPGHPYQNNVYLPTSLGGGPKGSILCLGRAAIGENGTAHSRAVHAFDLDARAWSRLTDNLAPSMSYETCVMLDESRGRYWFNTRFTENDKFLPYLQISDWTFHTDISWPDLPTGLRGNGGRGFMYQDLLFFQFSDGSLWSLDPDNPSTPSSGFQQCTLSGGPLPAYQNQFEYYPRTGKFYSITAAGGGTVSRLTPPASDWRNGTWALDTTSISPALHAQTSDGDGGGLAEHYGALKYISHPSINRLVWFAGGSNHVQALDPT